MGGIDCRRFDNIPSRATRFQQFGVGLLVASISLLIAMGFF
jgi:hypothetical protein